jgi:hypothetical protein
MMASLEALMTVPTPTPSSVAIFLQASILGKMPEVL